MTPIHSFNRFSGRYRLNAGEYSLEELEGAINHYKHKKFCQIPTRDGPYAVDYSGKAPKEQPGYCDT